MGAPAAKKVAAIIDVDMTKKKIEEMNNDGKVPKIAMFGGSLFLFPHPVKELADLIN